MKILSRILAFFSFLLLCLTVREFAEVYVLTRAVHPVFGYATLLGPGAFTVYFVVAPGVRIWLIPKKVSRRRMKTETNKFATAQLEWMKDVGRVANRPFVYGFDRLAGLFSQRRMA